MTRIDDGWTYQGFPLVRMESDALRVEVIPGLGGKIWTLEHRPTGRQFLWHNPRLNLRALFTGANYDDHFFGGFDELLPNDMPERVNGEPLVDHGELWTTPLDAQVDGERLVLAGELPITPLQYSKTLSIEGNCLRLDYRLTNTGRRPLDLLWKMHPALCISEGAEIVVPARTARVADPAWSRAPQLTEFDWQAEKALHIVPAAGNTTEFLYLLELESGECELRHPAEGWFFRMRFDKELFQSVWVFASFGGWRNLEVLILEPCTTPQISLADSARAGRCLHLEAGATLETSVEVEVGATN